MTEQRNLARFATISNAAFNSISANSTAILSMSVGGHTINATSFAGTANNATNLGGVAAASYQLNSTLAANVATMTSNAATFANSSATNTFTVGTAAYFVSNGNVGIGTATPSWDLHINDAAAPVIQLQEGTEGNTFIGQDANSFFIRRGTIGTTDALSITSGSNIGIGVTSPGNRLAVASSANTNDGIYYTNQNTGTGAQAVLGLNTQGAIGLQLGQNYSSKNAFIYLADAAALTLSTNAAVRMTIDAAGNIGIGTTTPAYPLTISRSGATDSYAQWINGGGGNLIIGAVGNGDALVYNVSNTNTLFHTNSTERMRITATGLVGIGTTTPGSVDSRLAVSGNFSLMTTGNKFYPYYFTTTNHCYISSSVGGDLTFGTGTGGVAERMLISPSGNIGIGTSSPVGRLDVRGEIFNYVGTVGTQIVLQSWGWDNAIARWKPVIESDASFALYNYNTSGGSPVRSFLCTNGSGSFTQFLNSARAPIFFDSDDTAYYVNPNGPSFLQGHTRFGPYAGSNGGGGGATHNITNIEIMNNGGSGDNNCAAISFHCQGAYGMHMHLRPDAYFGIGGWSAPAWRWYVFLGNGDMVTAGNVIAYSDPRLKEDIQKIESPVEKLKKLNGMRFKWRQNSILGRPGEYDYGVLANEVQEVFPEIVADSMHDSPDGDKYKAVAYDKLVPVLIEAVKAHQSEIDELKSLVKALIEGK